MNKVFGIGLNKTGTKTLGSCMKQLGYKHTSYNLKLLYEYKKNNFENIFNYINSFDSFEDWPWPLIYKELEKRYPLAKFILTLRESPEKWFESLCNHAKITGPTEARKIAYGHYMPHDNKKNHIDQYNAHYQNVLDYFSNKSNKLLVVCWEKGDGWQSICDFLDVPKPQNKFPHKNKRISL